MRNTTTTTAILFCLFSPALLRAQTKDRTKPAAQDEQPGSAEVSSSPSDDDAQPKPRTATPTPDDQKKEDNSEGKQTSRILWVVPNFAAVSANTQLPPLTVREKFKLGTEDSVDYSSFVWTGLVAAQSMALKSYPELGNGAAGYGR